MLRPDPQTVTRLLQGVRAGDQGAAESLLPVVYDELHGLAAALFSGQRKGHTLQPTALIHEAWLKLTGHLERLEDRHHFFVLAARAMRQVLADHARRAGSDKRGHARPRFTLDDATGAERSDGVDLLDFDDSLEHLARLNPRQAQVVELRVLGGLTIDETAEALAVSHATVERDWFVARAWLRRELGRR